MGDACRLLDVSPSTLRQWADAGHLRVYRTPGGHRRFLREDVVAFTTRDSRRGPTGAGANGQEAPEALEGSALRLIRRRLHQQGVAQQTWHRSVDDEGRLRMRLFGRRLLFLLAQEPTLRSRRQEALTEAYLLGRQYGSEMAEKAVGLKDTVEAFIFFRTMVMDSAANNSWSRILALADRVLVGLTDSYEERQAGTGSANQSPAGSSYLDGHGDADEPTSSTVGLAGNNNS